MSHQAELAVAMGATVVHDALLIHWLGASGGAIGTGYCIAIFVIAMHKKYESELFFPPDRLMGCMPARKEVKPGAFPQNRTRSVGCNVDPVDAQRRKFQGD
ncbi:MAG TPA: hypothetical protein VGJ75_07105 [Dongiaceae bacterium]